jgi:M6 family metalloprotease-like protein
MMMRSRRESTGEVQSKIGSNFGPQVMVQSPLGVSTGSPPRLCRGSARPIALLLAITSLALAVPAQATIVWEGKEVPAWPDVPLPHTPLGADVQFAQVGTLLFPHPSGEVHGLTILVDFSDQLPAYDKVQIDAWLNQTGYSGFGLKGSVRDYYFGQSNGKVNYQNEVHGFYRAKNPKSYYEGGTAYERADELWKEVVAALDPEIDFAKFDNDGDGKTEAISLLYAGKEGTFGKGLWPHASGSNEQRDGVRLSRYMMTAMNTQPTNYVFAHESGHMLFGWPDLYGVGDYCIMANRGSDQNPVGINDVFRSDQGWIELLDITASSNARLSSVPDGVVYRFLNPARPTEYFLWSNLQNQQEWASIKGSGLLVWHFDRAINGNNPPEPLQLAVVQAGGTRQLAATTWPSPGSAATDLFAKGGNAELGAQTQPSSKWNNGSPSGLRIYDVSAPGAEMQFSVGSGPLPANAGAGGSVGGNAGMGGNAGRAGGMNSGGTSSGGTGSTGVSLGGAAGSTVSAGGSSSSASGGTGVSAPMAGASGRAGASSSASTAGQSGQPAEASPPAEDSGCSCRVGAARPPLRSLTLPGGLLLALLLTRRHVRRRSHSSHRSTP